MSLRRLLQQSFQGLINLHVDITKYLLLRGKKKKKNLESDGGPEVPNPPVLAHRLRLAGTGYH